MTDDGSCPNLNAMHGHDVHVVALDGDKLKPRDEVRIVGGDGQIAGALPAEPGMKQQTYVVSSNSNGEDVAPTISAGEDQKGQTQTGTGGGVWDDPNGEGRSGR